jgi:hypothetical protein
VRKIIHHESVHMGVGKYHSQCWIFRSGTRKASSRSEISTHGVIFPYSHMNTHDWFLYSSMICIPCMSYGINDCSLSKQLHNNLSRWKYAVSAFNCLSIINALMKMILWVSTSKFIFSKTACESKYQISDSEDRHQPFVGCFYMCTSLSQRWYWMLVLGMFRAHTI